MKATDKEYMDMIVLWRSEIRPKEVEIDETVFEEIYKLQEEQDDKERIHRGQK